MCAVFLLSIFLLIFNCSAAGTETFLTYEKFGARGDGKTNDAEAIILTHRHANSCNLPVRARSGAHYYIGPMSTVAIIRTDTDWGTARFTIDDRKLTARERRNSIFTVNMKQRVIGLKKSVTTLKKGQKKIDAIFERPAMILVRNSNVKHFIRWGVNANSGSEMRDSFLVDENGNIDPATPVIWNFDEISHISARLLPEKTLTIKGGTFTTLANAEKGPHSYFSRNIRIARSNVLVENVKHYVKEPESKESHPYAGFISITDCANVTVKNCVFTGRKQYFCKKPNSQSTSTGTYDISINSSLNVKFINCTQSNDIFDRQYWGIMGSNKCKNLIYDRCRLSRFDAHQGVYNALIRDSELGHSGINVTGFGTLTVENSICNGRYMVNLRRDYGSFWDGKIVIRNSVWNVSGKEPALLTGFNNGTHWFGYNCILPETIDIDGLKVNNKNNRSPGYKGITLLGNFIDAPRNRKKADTGKYLPRPVQKVTVKNMKITGSRKYSLTQNKKFFKNTVLVRK